jgi:uncharacterized iron-regulated protein
LLGATFAIGLTMATSFPARACLGAGIDTALVVGQQVQERWKSDRHPLVGRALRTAADWTEKELAATSCGERTVLTETLRYLSTVLAYDAKVLLLGEVHDNAEHHWLRARIIERTHGYVAYAGRQGQDPRVLSVVMEQFTAVEDGALQKYRSLNSPIDPNATADEFKRLTGWQNSSWSKYPYNELLTSIVQRGMSVYAGDVTRAAIMKVAKEGEGALPAEDRARLRLDVPLGPKLDDASLVEIEEAHCGTMPKEAFAGMAYAQRYRDATLADNLLKAADKHGSAILIAGNGHVRTDRGVPWYIKQRAPDKKVVSVMLIEVEDGKTDPEAYVPRDPEGRPAADYIIFTPRAERPDPCEKMRAKMGK